MQVDGGVGERGKRHMGKDKFWRKWYLSTHPGLGMIEKGEVWKGTRRISKLGLEKGPR